MNKYLRKASLIKNILNNIFISKLGLLEIPFILMFKDSPTYEKWPIYTTGIRIGRVVVVSDGNIDIDYYYGSQYENDSRNLHNILDSLSDIIGYSMFSSVGVDIL